MSNDTYLLTIAAISAFIDFNEGVYSLAISLMDDLTVENSVAVCMLRYLAMRLHTVSRDVLKS